MANISCAYVQIEGDGCGTELVAYIKAAQKNATYDIVDDPDGREIDGDNCLMIEGMGNGRWTYQRNLEGYFNERDGEALTATRKTWCNGQGDKEWSVLVEKLKTGACIIINYIEEERGCGFISKGDVRVYWQYGCLHFEHHSTEYEYTVDNLMELLDMCRDEAIEYICGWCGDVDCLYCKTDQPKQEVQIKQGSRNEQQ